MTGQFSAVDSFLTGEENLRLMADLCHLDREEGGRRVTGLKRDGGLFPVLPRGAEVGGVPHDLRPVGRGLVPAAYRPWL